MRFGTATLGATGAIQVTDFRLKMRPQAGGSLRICIDVQI